MTTLFLQIYYCQNANYLSPKQIKEIRELKNKVPIYKIVKDYHIRKERVIDIWNNCECLQQDKENSLIVNNIKTQATNYITPNINTSTETFINTPNIQIKKKRSKFKFAHISDNYKTKKTNEISENVFNLYN